MKIVFKILILFIFLTQNSQKVYSQGLTKACGGTVESYAVAGILYSTFQWDAQGGTVQKRIFKDDTINNVTFDTIFVLWDKTSGWHTLSVTEQTIHNCIGPVNIDSVAVENPFITIEEKNKVICAVDTPMIYHATPGYSYYIWDKDSSIYSSYLFNVSGMHTVLARTYIDTRLGDSVRCTMADTTFLVVHPMPKVNLGNDTVLCSTELLELIGGIPDSLYTYNWSTGDISESIIVSEGVNEYWVKATSDKGCVTYDTINVLACTRSYLLGDIPNTFTPNDDGNNDLWMVTKLADFPEAKVEIYDRSGRLVWNSERSNKKSTMAEWDGRDLSNKELPMGAYFYIINLNRAGIEAITGHINLVR